MPNIELLDQITIDKIAAGEVVERPSSVVKELVENAIDAGATAVTVEIKAGGKELIRITDNGCGISRDMVAKAFLRHSTSKLRLLSDLDTITSFGFRGEALSSIAAVSQVELMTKTAASMIGTRYEMNGGKEGTLSDVGLPDGTTILVKNLFYNTPARSKFLKSDQTEGNYVNTLIEQMALSHPEVSFQFISNHAVKLQTSGNGKREDVIYQIYGREISKNLLPISAKEGPYEVSGFVGKPVITRGNRNFECYFINGRYVQNKTIAKAIEDSYHKHTYLMQHQFPFVMLYFTIDGRYVDVNVHPAKLEVRFSEGQDVYDFLCKAIEEALVEKEMIPEVKLSSEKEVPAQTLPTFRPEPFQKKDLAELKASIAKDSPYEEKYRDSLGGLQEKAFSAFVREEVIAYPSEKEKEFDTKGKNPSEEESGKNFETEVVQDPVQEDFTTAFGIQKEETKYFKIIGQVFATYWMVEYDGNLYVVDQHAAHEKINYERLMKRFAENAFHSQSIVPPMVVTLNAAEEAIFLKCKEEFLRFGFEMESFGGKEYLISGLPSELFGMDAMEFFHALLDEFDEKYSKKTTPDEIGMKLATAACKASVKGGDVLGRASLEALLKELFALEDPYHCPHGRPTMITISKQELEKMFKRIV